MDRFTLLLYIPAAMSQNNTNWRPHQVVRPVSIGVIWRQDSLLVAAVCNDAGAVEGWRPVGGSIEFGEPAPQALKREFLEELDEEIATPVLMSVIENFYEHYGMRGHEIVFVFETGFQDQAVYDRDRFEYTDGGVASVAEWIPVSEFRRGKSSLYPNGLLPLLEGRQQVLIPGGPAAY